ncbi:potassium channel subfamily K member 16 isoform 2-T2 [Glossophaga mutica]
MENKGWVGGGRLFALTALSASKLSCTVQTDSQPPVQRRARPAGGWCRSLTHFPLLLPKPAPQTWQSPGHAMPRAGLCHCWGSRVLPLLLAYICYLLLGATVFQMLEKQAEAQSRDQFQFEKLRFLENYTCLDQQALEQFVQVIMEAWVKGVNPKGNSTNPSNWDFGSSFFFAGTVVTTIGYGNLAPSTETGQVFCVFYALVGIPLNVIFLNHLGTGLRGHLTTLERWEDQPRRFQLLQILGLALFLTLGTLVILVFPPMVFSHVEGWSFTEGFYFAFITLSTIGFGDYVVGTDPSKHYISVYRSLAAIWILLGLAWLALVLPLGPLLLHRCSQLWLLSRELGLKEEGVPETNGLSRSQKIPISA